MKLIMYGILSALLALSIVVALQFRSIENSRSQGRDASCKAWTAFDKTLIAQVKAGEALAPTLKYYKRHPDELAKVLMRDEALIKALVPPSYC